MKELPSVILLPFHVAVFLLDVAVFFFVVRILLRFCSWQPLVFLNRLGAETVDTVTDAVAPLVRRLSERQLTRRQEEALVLLVLCLARWLVAAIAL